MHEDRRYRIAYVCVNSFVNLLYANQRDCEFLMVPILEGVPHDTTVEQVTYREDRLAFGLLLHHPSFSRVEPGSFVPEIDVSLVVRQVNPTPERLKAARMEGHRKGRATLAALVREALDEAGDED